MSEYIITVRDEADPDGWYRLTKPAEPLVRCRDCKRWIDDCEWNRFFNDPEIDEPDGFCAWGEPKEGAGE